MSEFDDAFELDDSSSDSNAGFVSRNQRMSTEEYIDIVERYNKECHDRSFVFVFGLPGSGKSHLIASILHYMESSTLGTSRLEYENTSSADQQKYNQMMLMFRQQDEVPRNPFNAFHELNVVFTPQIADKPETKLTFLDISGEACQQIYNYEHGDEFTGELPDFLSAVLESDVNCMFVLVYEPEKESTKRNSNKPPQDAILNTFYSNVLRMQQEKGKSYKKLLLVTKWDDIPMNQRCNDDVDAYVKKHLPGMVANFYSERAEGGKLNAITHYSLGKHIRGKLTQLDHERAQVVFEWIYEAAAGVSIKPKIGMFGKMQRYFMGEH